MIKTKLCMTAIALALTVTMPITSANAWCGGPGGGASGAGAAGGSGASGGSSGSAGASASGGNGTGGSNGTGGGGAGNQIAQATGPSYTFAQLGKWLFGETTTTQWAGTAYWGYTGIDPANQIPVRLTSYTYSNPSDPTQEKLRRIQAKCGDCSNEAEFNASLRKGAVNKKMVITPAPRKPNS